MDAAKTTIVGAGKLNYRKRAVLELLYLRYYLIRDIKNEAFRLIKPIEMS